MPEVVDPLGGSYFLERLTEDLQSGAREYFATIDRYGGKVGVHVIDVATGTVLAEHAAGTAFNPASNTKLVTAAAVQDGPVTVLIAAHDAERLAGDVRHAPRGLGPARSG